MRGSKMALATGTRLGPYEVLSLIGAGGMGEVWRARDTKLGRDVALKILPDSFAHDADRLARFQREARVLASLNHPHIAAIYGLEESGGYRALVLELVEGPTLADRITRGPMTLEEALPIAHQIADALRAAHDHAIVHRDLKPSNVKLRPDGTVKVLDFGLAKALDPPSGASDLLQSPTMTSPAFTGAGVILGTAAYMAPEQARGHAVDKRADIWAFGVVLFEMLAGTRPFGRATVIETLAAVVNDEPKWEACPARARRLLRGCLQKSPKNRLHDIGDANLLLEGADIESNTLAVRRSTVPWGVAALLSIAVATLVWAPWRSALTAVEPVRLQITLPDTVNTAGRNFVLSPDGRKLAFIGLGPDGVSRVWIRSMESLEVRALTGTETTPTSPPFFWSPDSRFIAYSAAGAKLKKVDLVGSLPQTLCDTTGPNAPGGAWNENGVLVFGSTSGPLMRVDQAGGVPSAVTTLDASRHETRHAYPTFLADRRHFLYLRTFTVAPERNGVYIGSIDVRPEQQDARQLVATSFAPVYVQSADRGLGHLLIYRDGNVLAQRFDERRMTLVGDPVPLVSQVGAFVASGFFSASLDVLVYRSSVTSLTGRLQWWRDQGTYESNPEQPPGVSALALSPDGRRAALVRRDPASGHQDIWNWDTTGTSWQMSFDPGQAAFPVWLRNGSSIVFASNRDGPWNLYRKRALESRQDEVLLKSSEDKIPTSVSSDGRLLLYTQTDRQTKNDIWVLSNPAGTPGDRRPVLNGSSNEREAAFSREAGVPRWIAYTSDESGRDEVYVREFSQAVMGPQQRISTGGGTNPRWRGDGRALFFEALDRINVMAVDVTPGAAFQAGAPRSIIRVPAGIHPNWDVTPDGKRFLVLLQQDAQAPFTVLQNWRATLTR